MHKYFADWYQFASSGQVSSDRLELRWSGVEKLKDGKLVTVLDLVRIAFRTERVAEGVKDVFRQSFKDADQTFLMTDNDVELSVLAGATLSVMLEKANAETDKAALCLSLSGFQLNEVPAWCKQFVKIADNYLARRLSERRQQKDIVTPTGVTQGFKQALEGVSTSLTANNPGDSGSNFTKFSELLTAQLNSFAKQTATAIRTLESELSLRREECDVLWWMTSRTSRDLKKTFDEVDLPASAIVLPKELADLISPPGALATGGILTHLLKPLMTTQARKQTTISATLKSVSNDFLSGINEKVQSGRLADLCPVLGAIDFHLKGSKWESQYKMESGIDSIKKIDLLELALQVHQECLLVNCVS